MAGPPCSICIHPKLAAIDAELAAGGKLIPVAKAFGVSKSTLSRHRADHLAPKLAAAARVVQPSAVSREPVERAKAIVAGELPTATDLLAMNGLLERLARSLERLEGAADDAAGQNLHTSLAALSGQLHRGIEAAAKLQGIGATAEVQQQPTFSITIVVPDVPPVKRVCGP